MGFLYAEVFVLVLLAFVAGSAVGAVLVRVGVRRPVPPAEASAAAPGATSAGLATGGPR